MKIKSLSVADVDDVWVYKNCLSSNEFTSVRHYLTNVTANNPFNYEGRTLNVDSKKYTMIGSSQYRNYYKLWQLTDIDGYWNNTNQTILKWAKENYLKIINPNILLLINRIYQYHPLDQTTWIPIRGIMNVLLPGHFLDRHIDNDEYLSKNNNVTSATFYVKTDGDGGFFWDERGILHKPEENSVLLNKGGKIAHGVSTSDKLRLAITIRFYNIEDLILPGSIDKLLYKP